LDHSVHLKMFQWFQVFLKNTVDFITHTYMLLCTLWKLRKESVDTEEAVDKYNDLHNASEKERLAHYERLVLAYYNLSTVFYEFGWGDCFHFAVFKPNETFDRSLLRHEYELVEKMKIQAGQSILDVGCGIGGPARNIASKKKVRCYWSEY